MIQEFIEYLNIYLTPLGFETKGLAALVTDDSGQRFPAVYQSGGEYEAVNVEGNVLYHRIISGPLITREAGPTVRYDIQERTYRMRVVAFFDHDLYCLDGPYQPDIVTGNITKVIDLTRVPELKAAFRLHSAQVQPVNTYIEADAWSSEFTAPYNSTVHVAAVDYDIILRGTVDCFNAYGCGDAPIDVLQLVIDTICRPAPDELHVRFTNDPAQTVVVHVLYLNGEGPKTVAGQALTGGSIDVGGVVVNAAPGVNTFVGLTLNDGDVVEVTYTASDAPNSFIIDLSFA